MVRIENHLGVIEVSNAYFANLIGRAVTECFGVAGMVSNTPVQGVRSMLSGAADILDKGVRVRSVGKELVIDLHIAVSYGVNIAAIAESIVHKVSYTVENACGMPVAKVNIFVAEMKLQ